MVTLGLVEERELAVHAAEPQGLLASWIPTGQSIRVRYQCTQQRPAGHVATGVWTNRVVEPFQRRVGGARAGSWPRGEGDGLDEPVDADSVRSEGDHAVSGEHTELLVGLPRVVLSAEDAARNAVWCIAGQDLQQSDRIGVATADGLDGDVPEPRDGLLRRALCVGIHSRRVAMELVGVLARSDASLDHVGDGLL